MRLKINSFCLITQQGSTRNHHTFLNNAVEPFTFTLKNVAFSIQFPRSSPSYQIWNVCGEFDISFLAKWTFLSFQFYCTKTLRAKINYVIHVNRELLKLLTVKSMHPQTLLLIQYMGTKVELMVNLNVNMCYPLYRSYNVITKTYLSHFFLRSDEQMAI